MATHRLRVSSDQQAAGAAAVRLLREILDYQRRLRRLSVHESTGEQGYLIEAYRRAIKLRQQLLEDLPKPRESAPDPWGRDRGRTDA
jgi:hypothetical protein